MVIVTNRNLQPKEPPTRRFGRIFNDKGPDELRLGEARKVHGTWRVEIVDDRVRYKGETMFASEYLFLRLQERMRQGKRNCLFFVHGYNNDFEDALERAHGFEQTYGVELVVFTWPANGGGVRGTASYLSDKRDARMSANALDRTFEKLSAYLKKHAATACEQNFSLVMHSMGNYLFKNLMGSSVYQGETLLFDNIVMAAADVNNEGHEEWVDRVQFRKRLYITLNENDVALRASRLKFGKQQLARLGHYTRNLTSKIAVYLDFTQARHVESSHAYFEDKPVRNLNVRRVFQKAFNGQRAETDLPYDPHTRTYRVS